MAIIGEPDCAIHNVCCHALRTLWMSQEFVHCIVLFDNTIPDNLLADVCDFLLNRYKRPFSMSANYTNKKNVEYECASISGINFFDSLFVWLQDILWNKREWKFVAVWMGFVLALVIVYLRWFELKHVLTSNGNVECMAYLWLAYAFVWNLRDRFRVLRCKGSRDDWYAFV